MKSNPRYTGNGDPIPSTYSFPTVAIVGVSVMALSGALVLIAAMPRFSLLVALVVGATVGVRHRIMRFERFAIPTKTVHVCLPFLGICIEGRVRQTSGVTD